MGGALLAVRNVLKAWLLLAGLCALLGGIGYAAGGLRALSFFLFAALLIAAAAYWYADRAALGLVGARELPIGAAPSLHSLVERLAAVAQIAKPKLYILPDSYPRAFAVGRGPGGSSLAISSGLAVFPPAELEAVLAHELAHVRHRDVLVATCVVVAAASIIELSRVGGFLQRGLLFVLAPLAAALVHLLLSPKREYVADRAAAELCASPHGLADALQRMDVAGDLLPFAANPATEPLYTVNPFAAEGLGALFETHPSLEERVRRLRALDPTWHDRILAA